MQTAPKPHIFPIRVYYEDTDAARIVYHSNYLNFAERARTEALRACGFDQSKLSAEEGIGFVVRRCEVDFIAPASLDDLLTVETLLHELTPARMTMAQTIRKENRALVWLKVELACVGKGLKPVRIPSRVSEGLRQTLRNAHAAP